MTQRIVFLTLVFALFFGFGFCEQSKKQPIWISPSIAAEEAPSFLIQGEYGIDKAGQDWAIQVVALGGENFEAYVLEGGFPGRGFVKGNRRIRLIGKRKNDFVSFDGKEVSSIFKGRLSDGAFVLQIDGNEVGSFPRVIRSSPTLGKLAPDNAVILFDGSNDDQWNKTGVIENGLLKNKDISTRRKFGSYHMHLEFRTPYKPFARGQARGNSGVYHQGRYETQVLDAFGLEGKMNETGGLYSIKAPDLNMCLPPLEWQTYDVDLESAKFDDSGKLLSPGRMTVRLNGVLIHDNVELPKATPGHKTKFGPGPGSIFIQGHGNPVYYRNIWLVEK